MLFDVCWKPYLCIIESQQCFNYLIALVLLYHGTFLLVDWLIDWTHPTNTLSGDCRDKVDILLQRLPGSETVCLKPIFIMDHVIWTVFSNSHPVTSEFDYSQQTVNTLSVTEVTVTYYQCNVCVCAYIHTYIIHIV